jgi:hypothetical protein
MSHHARIFTSTAGESRLVVAHATTTATHHIKAQGRLT